MKYKTTFKELIEKSINNNQYVGLGNPNSKILIIGKEPGFDISDENKMQEHTNNAKDWKEKKEYLFKGFCPDKPDIRNKAHTWQKYQKFHDIIFNCSLPENYCITFVEKIFTTELSNLPARNSGDAKKKKEFKTELSKRKIEFFRSDFIQQFPIVIIAAMDSNYITKDELSGEENINLFGVKFCKMKTCSSKNKYYIHHSNSNQKKLLIHTRQFSNGVSDLLIRNIAKEIKEFSKNNGLKLLPNN